MNIRERILARGDLAELRAARDIDGLAAALNAEDLLVRQSRFITWRAIITRCSSGEAIRDKLEAAAPSSGAIRSAVEFLSQEAGLDVGDLGTWANIDKMVQTGVLTAHEGQQLKDLALKPLIVTREEVRLAMFNDDGTEK